MKHSHPHRHWMKHPHALGTRVEVRHAHEHEHSSPGEVEHGTFPDHRMHRHTPEQEADLRKQQRHW